MDWETHKKLLLGDKNFRKVVKKTRLEYEIARAVILARIKQKMTQKELARKLKTKQSVVSRLENVQTIPSLSFLKRLAAAFNSQLEVRFTGL